MATIRKVPLVTNETYHIFNRGIDRRTTFMDNNELDRFVKTLGFYIYSSPPIRLSRFLDLEDYSKKSLESKSWGGKLVTIFGYCIMPNHFHILLRQEVNGGVSRFIGQLLNSYTRYFNTKNKRVGQLFLDQFKNVLVENENQLLHLSRYIHLNPLTAGIVNNTKDLLNYNWSSLHEYLTVDKYGLCKTSIISSFFKTKDGYKNFVLDNSNYQRELSRIRHLVIE